MFDCPISGLVIFWSGVIWHSRPKTHYPVASHNSLKMHYFNLDKKAIIAIIYYKCQYVFTVTTLLVLQTNGEIAWFISTWDSLGNSHNLPRIFFCFSWNKNPTSWWNSYTYDGYMYIIIMTENILTKDLSTSKTNQRCVHL